VKLKRILARNSSYAILDASPAKGGTWAAGGCHILADALNECFRLPEYVVYNNKLKRAEHFMVLDESRGRFIDADGIQGEQTMLDKIAREKSAPGTLSIRKVSANTRSEGIPHDHKASQTLCQVLRKSWKPEDG
jgi:hypothetical protein